jgi:hypothetical protein
MDVIGLNLANTEGRRMELDSEVHAHAHKVGHRWIDMVLASIAHDRRVAHCLAKEVVQCLRIDWPESSNAAREVRRSTKATRLRRLGSPCVEGAGAT